MATLLQERVSAPTVEREREIAALGPWFHNLHLPDGSQTAPQSPLGDFPAFKWQQLAPHLPEDLSGWTALDIGCNAGFYTFELAKRGATVTALDAEMLFLRQAEWAAREFGLTDQVRFEHGQVYDLAHEADAYDLVLFMGLFYHLRYPLLALDIVADKVKRLLVFQTLTMPGTEVFSDTRAERDIMEREMFNAPGWPKMAFIEHSYAGDDTNWWAPNHSAVEALLRSSGMSVTSRPGHEMYLCEPDHTHVPWRRGAGAAELMSATGGGRRCTCNHASEEKRSIQP
ncbi:MAG TPA: TIGR04290 family methyltransferase [Gemmatimonadaceae bacterium]|nr:TIGR04290 family methyltransferase [Gemmatimonadaceae bacterium]